MARAVKLTRPAVRFEPAPDFPLYGADASWIEARHLDQVDAHTRLPPSAVWLAHTREDDAVGVRVGTVHRDRTAFPRTTVDIGAEEALALRVAHALVDLTSPRAGEFLRAFGRSLPEWASAAAREHADWRPVRWFVDGHPVAARIWDFAGAWGAFSAKVGGVHLLANGVGVEPDGLRLVTVDESFDYGVDLTVPLPNLMPGASSRDTPFTRLRNPNGNASHPDHEARLH